MKKHTLHLIGYLSSFRAYLDVPLEEAIERYVQDDGYAGYSIKTIEFDEEFEVYDAYQCEKD